MEQTRVFDRIADDERLDTVGDALRRGVHAVLRPGMVKDLLHGVFLGHPLHPALVQVPIGCFASAAVLDIGGSSREATRLIGLGVLSSVPAAAAGLADYADSERDHQRIGVVRRGQLGGAGLLRHFPGVAGARAGAGRRVVGAGGSDVQHGRRHPRRRSGLPTSRRGQPFRAGVPPRPGRLVRSGSRRAVRRGGADPTGRGRDPGARGPARRRLRGVARPCAATCPARCPRGS
ncbi:DUF2231 domain-containing protein [Kutzneria sp. 744]|uniref:DUF2231 domain-containing protein n=1 Tax=Kutzneria sp. (strain 744) TaxID=345341 RepID=UPI00350EF1A6